MQSNQYPLSMRAMHWTMAILLIGMLAMGLYMTDLERADPMRMVLYDTHKAFGVFLLILVFVRLAIRMASVKPALPDAIKPHEALAAKSAYVVFYGVMIAIPVTGYSMSAFAGFPVKFLGMELPRFLPIDRGLSGLAGELHEWLAYVLIAMIGLHILAVIKHIVFDKVNLLKRMW